MLQFFVSGTAITYGYVTFTCGSCGGTSVPTSVNLNLDGNMSLTTTNVSQLPEASLGVEVRFDSVQDTSVWSIGRIESSSGMFTGLATPGQTTATIPVGSVFTSGTYTVPLNTPVLVFLQLDAWIQNVAFSGPSNTASSDFQHTMSFALNGPVFNLPSGFTANSEDFGIVDNRFPAVPEPGFTALAGVCLLLMLIRRRPN